RMLTAYDKFNIAIIWTIDILAITANILLIWAILFKTPKALRTYSVFLLNNAIIDLVSAVTSALGTVRMCQGTEPSMNLRALSYALRSCFCRISNPFSPSHQSRAAFDGDPHALFRLPSLHPLWRRPRISSTLSSSHLDRLLHRPPLHCNANYCLLPRDGGGFACSESSSSSGGIHRHELRPHWQSSCGDSGSDVLHSLSHRHVHHLRRATQAHQENRTSRSEGQLSNSSLVSPGSHLSTISTMRSCNSSGFLAV
ncbi:hypothetical protein PMAYCL1PPCAC_15517, partial [Pristionchus mayeri]